MFIRMFSVRTLILMAFMLGIGVFSIRAADEPQLKPTLKYPTLKSYEAAIKEPGILYKSRYVWLFAPLRRKQEALVVCNILVKAYAELYRIVGVHTKYKVVVYNFPKGNKEGWGGTSECSIEYDDSNLDFAASEEWTKYRVPHVSGYIEEMAHNFVGATHVQFGWEMVGWSLGVMAAKKVADNPIFERSLEDTWKQQAETFARYRAGGNTFPADIEPNLCDRIHAYLLGECLRRYGVNFWPDFFREVRKEQGRLNDAVNIKGDDGIRNARYQITLDCFDRLPGLNFKRMLEQNGISLKVDVKSLHPTDAGWNRKFVEGR